MQLNMRAFLATVAAIVLMAAAVPMAALGRQTDAITLSVAIPDYLEDVFSDQLIAEFEDANPGVKLHLKFGVDTYIAPPADGLEAHLESLSKVVATGDVVMVSARSISPASVSAGYFFDLAPFANGDATLNVTDFPDAVWKSFELDKGLWGMPLAASVSFLSYSPSAFDKAGMAYPNEAWTLDDLANANNTLMVKDESGEVTSPALVGLVTGYNDGALIRSLSGIIFYDESSLPAAPRLNTPDVEAFANVWMGLIGEGEGNFIKRPMKVMDIPMLIDQQGSLLYPNPDMPRVNLLFPGGKAGLDVQGFAVSGGTQYPEQAYALVKYLSTRPDFATFFGSLPARNDLMADALSQYTADDQQFVMRAFENAIPVSELRYMDYFNKAILQSQSEQMEPKTALETQEFQAVNDLQTAAAKKTSEAVMVATVVPTPNLAAGEVAINFGLGEFASPLPNQALWDEVIAEFTSSDPEVRQVNFRPNFSFGELKDSQEKYDCFYVPINFLTAASTDSLLSLDPLLAADPTFDKADMVATTLEQMTIANQIWGLPIVLTPFVLKANNDSFNKLGVEVPDSTWSVDKFKDTLTQLKNNSSSGVPLARYQNANSMMMLLAAYGGVPLDFRTDPLTINFTDPATVDAIREVAELVKQGYLGARKFGDLTGMDDGTESDEPPALFDDSLYPNAEEGAGLFTPIGYPHGTQYAAASYAIGFAGIVASTQYPEPCYRWISTFAKHPELFAGMPARRSLMSDPALIAAQGEQMVATYNALAEQLASPNTLIFPDSFGADQSVYLLQHWLFEAFDAYVHDDADLELALAEAETYAKNFQECALALPPYDSSSAETGQEYYKEFSACAVKVDPRLSTIFTGTTAG
jgi:ABC-type glycerol-3-phosphate transport system substrate-binding protein